MFHHNKIQFGGNLMKRRTLLIVTLLLASQFLLAACSSEDADTGTQKDPASEFSENVSGTVNTDVAQESSEQSEIETEPDLYAALVPKDYDGYSFDFHIEGQAYGTTDMDYPEMTGDIIVDTIYTRNRSIEDILNIVISQEYGAAEGKIKEMHMAGDDIYDVFWLTLNQMDTFKREYLYNLYDIKGIDWDAPWWEESVRKDYETCGKLYFTQSPMNLHFYESLVPILFNKDIAKEYQLEDLYTIVKDGRWTLDKMAEVSTSVITDLDGNGVIEVSDDLFGFTGAFNILSLMTVSAGARYSEMGENGIPVFLGLTEKLQSSVEKISKTFSAPNNAFDGDHINIFLGGHALFFLDTLGRVKDFRAAELDFGILPYAKYDETQEEYISTVVGYADCMIVPSTNREAANIGTILTYLSAYSYRDLIPAFYEKSVTGKQFRDQESVEMLELMLSNVQTDPTLTFEWCGMMGLIQKAIQNNGEGLASKFQAMDKAMDITIDRMYGKFAD